jgi:hypothetical protein
LLQANSSVRFPTFRVRSENARRARRPITHGRWPTKNSESPKRPKPIGEPRSISIRRLTVLLTLRREAGAGCCLAVLLTLRHEGVSAPRRGTHSSSPGGAPAPWVSPGDSRPRKIPFPKLTHGRPNGPIVRLKAGRKDSTLATYGGTRSSLPSSSS